MNQFLFAASAYCNYILKSKSAYRIHQPFLFDFYNEVLHDKKHYPAYDTVMAYRSALLKDETKFEKVDLGVGSHHSANKRKVKEEAEVSGVSNKFGKLLYRLLHNQKCAHVLELGTSMGIGTAWMASALEDRKNAKLISIEGCRNTHQIAKEQFNLHLPELKQVVEFKQGSFEKRLQESLHELPKLDMVYIDGHHEKSATIQYFEYLKPWLRDGSILVFDDIHWSRGMEEAWEYIGKQQPISLSIDLFRMGICFCNSGLSQQQMAVWF